MVYVIRTYLAGPLGAIGRRFGLSSEGSAGVVSPLQPIYLPFIT